MAKASEISIWLHSNQDYHQGLLLFEKYGTGGFILTILRTGDDDYNREKLVQELQKIEDQHQEKEVLTTGVYTGNDYTDLPNTIKEMIAQVKQIYKENGARHALISHQKTDHDRAVLAHTILDEDREARHLLKAIDHYKEFKTIPNVTKKEIEDSFTEADILRRITNLRSQISKNRKKRKSTIELEQEIVNLNMLLDELI